MSLIWVSGKWRTDEIRLPTDKGGRYMAGVPDAEYRFMLANETYPEAGKLQVYDATNLFKCAVDIAKTIPSVLISDLLSGFTRGFENVILKCKKNTVKRIKNPHTYAPHQYENATSTTASLSVKTAR